MAIGCQKHGKTESYREYVQYISRADERFIEAPGIRGMVMLVFTLPGSCPMNWAALRDTYRWLMPWNPYLRILCFS